MTDHPGTVPTTDTANALDRRPPGWLESTGVRYEGRPNRCTIYPSTTTGVERTSTWLTADADVFVPLWTAR